MFKYLTSPATLVALALGLSGAGVALYAWGLPPFSSTVQTTDNAFVRGKVAFVSSQLAGHVVKVNVQDFQRVTKGQLLVTLDDGIYSEKVEQAKAALAMQQATLANTTQQQAVAQVGIRSAEAQLEGTAASLKTAKANFDRMQPLLQKGVVNESQADAVQDALATAIASQHKAEAALQLAKEQLQQIIVSRDTIKASIDGAEAAVRLAQLDLDNTKIIAPEDGRVGEVGARPGQYVTPGTQLVAVVPDQTWVVANFKENQIAGIRRGLPVEISVDALNHDKLTGRVESFSPATGAEFSVLKTDNATGNYTKVAQRLPVRITIDPGQAQHEQIVPGMSVVVRIDTAAKDADVAETDAQAANGG